MADETTLLNAALSKIGASVITGIDVLRRDGFRQLAGRNIGLITNHTGVDQEGNKTIDLAGPAKLKHLGGGTVFGEGDG